MKIAVCIKQIPDINEIKINPETNTLNRNVKDQVINPVDLNALELANTIKKKLNAEVSAISMGNLFTKKSLAESIALGADDAFLVCDPVYAGSDTFATANTLKESLNHIGKFSLIICGNKASDGETGQTHTELAEALGIPQINNVLKIYRITKKYIFAKTMNEQGSSIAYSKLPVLISVVKAINTPRLPSLKDYYTALKKEIKVINNRILNIKTEACGIKGSPTKVIKINNTVYDKNTVFLSGTVPEIAKKLIDIINKKNNNSITCEKTFPLNKKYGTKKILLIGELNNGRLNQSVFPLIKEAKKINVKLKAELSIVFLGHRINKNFVNDLDLHKVYFIDKKELKNFDAGLFASYISGFVLDKNPEIILGSATLWGRILFPRVAAKLKTGLTADCTELDIDKNGKLLQIRPALGGNISATILCSDTTPQMATFNPLFIKNENTFCNPEIINFNIKSPCSKKSERVKTVLNINKTKDSSIRDAEIIISGGKGTGGKNGFNQLFKLAQILGGKVGASRSAVEAGWINYPHQVGQTGVTVKPRIYIACGISGASQHLAGMKSSDLIIAINKDKNAPIFSAADFGIIEDYKLIIDELIARSKIGLTNFVKRKYS